jgi:hypothetical protein
MSSIFTKLKDVGEAILDIGPKVVPCISNFGKVKHTKTELVKLSAKIATQLEKDYGLKGNVTDNLKAFISDSITSAWIKTSVFKNSQKFNEEYF